ncbi:hypothetical protein NX059_004934 [Plenodomus lindquistii]|nr:hypothetical protein NX059_004934 [Plenodomus lindquistii]
MKSPAPSSRPSSPHDNETDGPQSVGQVVDSVVNGVKATIDGVLTWAEEKVEGLSAEPGDTGPYSSPALCAPSDLDPIASGVLPTMPSENHQKEHQGDAHDTEPKGVENSSSTERKS